jgi:antitoxin component YwqK of YwqJK toxin-antitoxin module
MKTDPTTVKYYENGKIEYQLWKINDKCHNDNGPAFIRYYKNCKIQSQPWYINGELHNENGPAYIYYYENGQIQSQEWYVHGELHNENGPAHIWYDKNGKIEVQFWNINGIRHNENGPAEIYYYENGPAEIYYQEWHINGLQLSDHEIIIQKELIEKRKQAINVISKNWLISKWNGIYREFLTQVLTVPENHDSLVGKLFPNGGYDYKKFKESLLTF